MDLLSPRKTYKFGWVEVLVLLAFCAIALYTIPFHEAWSDEAQAWLIARDLPLQQVLFHQLHYEGTPGLWSVLLWAAARLHLPFGSIQYISAACAAVGVYLFLRFSPFPLLLRILLPFTFYLQYQYAVIARSYVLFPIAAFVLCILYTSRKPRPLWFALVAGLMANESMHGALFAAGISVAYAVRLWHGRQSQPVQPSRLWLSAALLTALGGLAFVTALPAPDVTFPTNMSTAIAKPHTAKLLSVLTGIPVPKEQGGAFPPEFIDHTPLPPPPHRSLPVKLIHFSALRLYNVARFALYPISTWKPLAALFLVLALFMILRLATVWVLVPYALLLVGMVAVHSVDHHAGMLFIALIACLWLAFAGRRESVHPRAGYELVFTLVFSAVALLQVQWTAHAVHADVTGPYDGGAAAARFLRQNAAGKTIVSFADETVSIEPYFSKNIFANRSTAYWRWDRSQAQEESPQLILNLHPQFAVLATTKPLSQSLNYKGYLPWETDPEAVLEKHITPRKQWLLDHFHETHRFCGAEFARNGAANQHCLLIFEP